MEFSLYLQLFRSPGGWRYTHTHTHARTHILTNKGCPSDLDNVTSATSHTTSFESNTDAIVAGEGGGDGGTVGEPEVEVPREHGQSEAEVSQTPITLPSSEARRTSYRAILANRLKVNIEQVGNALVVLWWLISVLSFVYMIVCGC